MPPPTQRCTRPCGDANVRIVSARSKSPFGPERPERAHRRAAADRLERGDQVERRDLRRAGHRAAGERRREDLRERRRRRAAGPRRSRRGASRPASSRCAISSGQRTDPARRRARGRCARGRRSSRARRRPSRPRRPRPRARVPLIGIVRSGDPRRARKQLRRGRDDRPAVAGERPRHGAAGAARARPRAPAGSPANGADRCWTRFTW